MRILLAEDERILSDALAAILEKNSFSVDAVYDGEEALDYLSVGEYDVAILDIMMPGLDGISVLRKIRGAGNNIPVIMLTAKSETSDKITGLDCGADDYLTKPFAVKELLARLRAVTRRGSTLADNTLRFSDIELRRSDRMLIAPAGSLRLANKEYQILEYLMLNHGQFISTERFMEMIWGFDSDAEINVVWVNLSGLRRKLSELGAHVAIRVVRGTGYMLEEI